MEEKKRLGFIVSFRDRYFHLSQFIPHYSRRFKDAKIYIIEQGDEKPFNRGWLSNIGYQEFKDQFDYFAIHDIDLLCTKGNYDYCGNPTQLATHAQQFRYQMPFPEYFGGATLFNNKDFELVNGFSNLFEGYGAEDENLYHRVIETGLTVDYRDNYYMSLHHTRQIDPVLHAKNVELLKQPIDKTDGLTSLRYTVIDKIEFPLYTKLIVNL